MNQSIPPFSQPTNQSQLNTYINASFLYPFLLFDFALLCWALRIVLVLSVLRLIRVSVSSSVWRLIPLYRAISFGCVISSSSNHQPVSRPVSLPAFLPSFSLFQSFFFTVFVSSILLLSTMCFVLGFKGYYRLSKMSICLEFPATYAQSIFQKFGILSTFSRTDARP